MGVLDKYAKTTSEGKTKSINFKIQESLYEAFEKQCAENNLTMSEALRILVTESTQESGSPKSGSIQQGELRDIVIAEKKAMARRMFVPLRELRERIYHLTCVVPSLDWLDWDEIIMLDDGIRTVIFFL